ncbi:AraC family transcriptional regulator [Pseudomonas sp. JQ170]|uniref:AraC family transcriptional regulator n=1 Tax=unclassified Pseudomonas TaxID=196821 RepID=UPI0026511C85|nr:MULTISPECIES: AraC family transcriptional regulator [unclassified Pseudomonas]MDN7141295.1 AraC family transcriptional regulator [Pseudomonas sp. JQ170]WRO78128.1 AraC family transcriptional regulator [Pseudomonas sp. 170C]
MTQLIVGAYGTSLDIPQHNMLGLPALVAELQSQDVDPVGLLQGSELSPAQMLDPNTRISHRQKLVIFANMQRLMRHADSGLRAGGRQRLSDFGIFGYAMMSSETFGQAVDFGIRHIRLLGPIFEKSFRLEGSEGVFSGQGFFALGELMPLATEFWFASIHSLVQCVLEKPFPSVRLLLPYPAPEHWQCYEAVFRCPVVFNSEVMEWRFDASVLQLPCPNANPITSAMTMGFCQQLVASLPDESDLIESVRMACLSRSGRFPGVDAVAEALGMSTRTLHRRLAEQQRTYQSVLDEVRCALAIEFLQQSDMPMDELAAQVGFSEAANFRKAFRKWTGQSPGDYRKALRSGL